MIQINHKFVDFAVDLLKVIGISLSIPFGSTINQLMVDSSEINLIRFIISFIFFCLGVASLILACIIRKRYY